MAEWLLGVAGSEVRLTAGDCELSEAEEGIEQRERNTQGDLTCRYTDHKRTWDVTYSWIPGLRQNTFDGGMGRNDLRALLLTTSALSFHVPTEGAAVEDVTVVFDLGSWREKLLQTSPFWAYELSFTLVEV